ncbi:hypothetical protein T484DRAFT_1931900 [Baffinella frigidus]|nr:hypothetical protein T484DRAFT_1931900 [Cryptophyta sp. CCMP2293]
MGERVSGGDSAPPLAQVVQTAGGPGARPPRNHKNGSFTASEKAAAIRYWEDVLHQKHRAELCSWFSRTFQKKLMGGTFSVWLRNRDAILEQASGASAESMRVRSGVADRLGLLLFEWYTALEDKVPLTSDENLIHQARTIVHAMPDGDLKQSLLNTKKFNFSQNWIGRWKKHYHLGRHWDGTAPDAGGKRLIARPGYGPAEESVATEVPRQDTECDRINAGLAMLKQAEELQHKLPPAMIQSMRAKAGEMMGLRL